jgi:hypothetical protein
MAEPVTHEEQITCAWLTNTLRRGGHLPREGFVSGLDVSRGTTLFSDIYRLEASYSATDDADEAAALRPPSKLLLKVPLADKEVSLKMGKDEVAAYRTLSESMEDPPLVRCLDAVYSDASGRSHLLLEDMSDTHFQPELPLPPSRRHGELCVEALAQLHAFWWEHPDLGASVGELYDERALRGIVARLREALSGFAALLGDTLSPSRLEAFESALAFVPHFWLGRLTSTSRNTLIHGDAHQWNILHPKDTERGRALLIDLATSNRVRPATNDLAYMMALQWYPERRAVMEEALLRHYHAALVARGVRDYSWEDCRLDYRHSVIAHLFTPLLQWAGGQIPATVWWHNLERISEAYRDLNCDELVTAGST